MQASAIGVEAQPSEGRGLQSGERGEAGAPLTAGVAPHLARRPFEVLRRFRVGLHEACRALLEEEREKVSAVPVPLRVVLEAAAVVREVAGGCERVGELLQAEEETATQKQQLVEVPLEDTSWCFSPSGTP